MAFRLIVISGHEYLFPGDASPVSVYDIHEGHAMIIGRGGSADVRLAGHDAKQDMVVARRQADLELIGGFARILDYGSARGERFRRTVAVNGQYLEGDGTRWLQLSPGDEIRVGDALFKLEKDNEGH